MNKPVNPTREEEALCGVIRLRLSELGAVKTASELIGKRNLDLMLADRTAFRKLSFIQGAQLLKLVGMEVKIDNRRQNKVVGNEGSSDERGTSHAWSFVSEVSGGRE